MVQTSFPDKDVLQFSMEKGEGIVYSLNRSQLAAKQAISKDLPEFSGNPEDWPLFFSIFNSSTQLCGFSNEENTPGCVALEVVKCRLLLSSSVQRVMSTLKMLYGRQMSASGKAIRVS